MHRQHVRRPWAGVGSYAGCTFADFDGHSSVYAADDARLSLVQCTFAGNTIFPGQLSSVISASGGPVDFVGSSKVRLEGVHVQQQLPLLAALPHR